MPEPAKPRKFVVLTVPEEHDAESALHCALYSIRRHAMESDFVEPHAAKAVRDFADSARLVKLDEATLERVARALYDEAERLRREPILGHTPPPPPWNRGSQRHFRKCAFAAALALLEED